MALLKVILISRVYLYQFSASEGTLQGRFPEAKIHRKDAMAQRSTAYTEHNSHLRASVNTLGHGSGDVINYLQL